MVEGESAGGPSGGGWEPTGGYGGAAAHTEWESGSADPVAAGDDW